MKGEINTLIVNIRQFAGQKEEIMRLNRENEEMRKRINELESIVANLRQTENKNRELETIIQQYKRKIDELM